MARHRKAKMHGSRVVKRKGYGYYVDGGTVYEFHLKRGGRRRRKGKVSYRKARRSPRQIAAAIRNLRHARAALRKKRAAHRRRR